jgi:hypothetical protein
MDPLTAILNVGGKLIDRIIPDEAARAAAKVKLVEMHLAGELEVIRNQAGIITAEASGESWLQRNWRPITMLSFLGLLWAYWLGQAPDYVVENPDVVAQVFDLLKIGIGGYIVGRSVEKTAKTWKVNGGA